MIAAWRIDKAERSRQDSFSGEGARRVAGRWNGEGRALVYAAESLALAALEKLVHLGREGLGPRFASYRVDIPASVRTTTLALDELPRTWREYPAPAETRALGDAWLAAGRTAVLVVPSVVIPSETNFLLNPAHADFAKLRISGPEPFSFDARLGRLPQ